MKDSTIQRIISFRDDRNWKQFHSAKDLAISISLEANELLELFQWSKDDVECLDKQALMKEELADVLVYCIQMADYCGFDLDEIIMDKMSKNEAKYPIAKAKDSKKKYNE